MMRKFLLRPTLVDERTKQRQLAEHHNKLRHATHAIDCLAPPIYSHLTCKLKKLQLEHERIWRIENENRRLLSRLAEIMNGRAITSTNDTRYRSGQSRASSHNKFRGGPYRPMAAKGVRRRQLSNCQRQRAKTSNQDDQDQASSNWEETPVDILRRPHTVAVMAARSEFCASRPNSTVTFTPRKNKARKMKERNVLCGCASRLHQPPPSSTNAEEAGNTEGADPAPPALINSPLNDVTDLLCGIQSVEITVKQPSTEC